MAKAFNVFILIVPFPFVLIAAPAVQKDHRQRRASCYFLPIGCWIATIGLGEEGVVVMQALAQGRRQLRQAK
jgi:hypothetical protein